MLGYKFYKRFIDILLASFFIVVTLPFQFIICLLLSFMLLENPFFAQERGLTLGKYRFTLLKFRTIHSSANQKNTHLHSEDIFLLPNLAFDLNWFTRWLRKTGLDELPQIYNVLFGQMSFVGPRPLMIQDLLILEREFPRHYMQRQLINSKPGLTGLWQIFGDRSKGIENLIGLDIFYEEEKSFELDLKIFLLTIPIVLFAKNSDAIIHRRNLISKLFSLPLVEINFIYSKNELISGLDAEKPSRYSITIPSNWWLASASDANHLKYELITDSESSGPATIGNNCKYETDAD